MPEGWNRLYDELAWLWPRWGAHDSDEYVGWCARVLELLREHATRPLEELLILGCGGGKTAWSLKKELRVTGLDRSRPMLQLARRLNPECAFVQGDMRSFELGRQFDAVLIDDGISYMLTPADLEAAFRRAHTHLRRGGAMVVAPDHLRETFRQHFTKVTPGEAPAEGEGSEVIFVENSFDPDPADTSTESTHIYLIREHGELRVELDRHEIGLFSMEQWRQALRAAGFDVHEHLPPPSEPGVPVIFACGRG